VGDEPDPEASDASSDTHGDLIIEDLMERLLDLGSASRSNV
jgi:hypothetical protein